MAKPIPEAVRAIRDVLFRVYMDHDDFKVTTALLHDMAVAVSSLTAAQQQGQALACERCAGSGTVTATDTTRGPDGHDFDADCPHCDGTGDVHRPDGEWRGRCNCDQPMQQGGGEDLPVCVCCEDCGTEIEAYCPKCNTAPPSAPVGVERLHRIVDKMAADRSYERGQAVEDLREALAQQPAAATPKLRVVGQMIRAITPGQPESVSVCWNDMPPAGTALYALATQHQEPKS